MMAEAKDPTIKLFGKTIPLLENDFVDNKHTSLVNNNLHAMEDISSQEIDNNDKGDQNRTICQIEESEVSFQRSHKSVCQDPSPILTDNVETFSIANEKIPSELSKLEEEKLDTSTSQEKTLKKPDKIISCPRCNSMDTKFCYYNNYNANQPRHFCKKCQRYWTAGGTMRNVPVGAGRRKNKSSASHFRQINVSEALENRPDILNGFHRGLQTNGAASTFGLDSPLCESMASILSLAEKTMRNFSDANGLQKHGDLKVQIPFVPMETRVEDATNSSPKESVSQSCHPYSQITCYPRPPWPYPWSSAQWTPPTTAPPFCPNNLGVPFYPTPSYWGCMVPATWNNPWITQPYPMSKSSPSSGPNSPLGKHSRDGNMITSTSSEEKETADVDSERSLWIPKTSRIDDRGEGTKSSTWTALGMKTYEKSGSIGHELGLFRAFQLKCDEKTPMLETSTLLEANPTSLSRSQNM